MSVESYTESHSSKPAEVVEMGGRKRQLTVYWELRQGFMFEASDRFRSLSLAQINNLGSDLSLASIVKITRCLQVFVLTSTFLNIRFTRKVSPPHSTVFGLQYSEFTYHPSLAMAIAARCTKIARTPSKLCWPRGL